MAKKLDHEIMRHVLRDLNPGHEKKVPPSNTQSNATKASAEQPKRKKRKRSSAAKPPEQNQHCDLEAYALKNHIMEHPELKIAALEMMETHFTVVCLCQTCNVPIVW